MWLLPILGLFALVGILADCIDTAPVVCPHRCQCTSDDECPHDCDCEGQS